MRRGVPSTLIAIRENRLETGTPLLDPLNSIIQHSSAYPSHSESWGGTFCPYSLVICPFREHIPALGSWLRLSLPPPNICKNPYTGPCTGQCMPVDDPFKSANLAVASHSTCLNFFSHTANRQINNRQTNRNRRDHNTIKLL